MEIFTDTVHWTDLIMLQKHRKTISDCYTIVSIGITLVSSYTGKKRGRFELYRLTKLIVKLSWVQWRCIDRVAQIYMGIEMKVGK